MLRLEHTQIQNGDFALRADLTVETGQIVAVIGPSGAGKSTLIGAVAGFQPVTGGTIAWDGRRIDQLAPGKRPVAMLFQDANLFPHLSIAQNVGLGIRPDLRLTTQQKTQVNAALARVGLDGMETRKPAQLSGGQQSRAALARVLVQDRPLVLLDEPFAALGPALRADMLSLVAQEVAAIGATVLMVSHDPEDARQIADSVILVAGGQDGGRAHPPVATTELFANPPEALRAYLGDRA